MGIHLKGGSRNMRQTRPYIEKIGNSYVAVLKMNFSKNSKRFEYVFLGNNKNLLTFAGVEISNHPVFKNITEFEDWCNVYTATHDIK